MTLPDPSGKVSDFKTYSGQGIDDPTANVRADLSPLGFHASIRSAHGIWYVEPASRTAQTTYVSYYGRDLRNVHGSYVEREVPSPTPGRDAVEFVLSLTT